MDPHRPFPRRGGHGPTNTAATRKGIMSSASSPRHEITSRSPGSCSPPLILQGMKEARRPTGPVVGLLVAGLAMLGQFVFLPLLMVDDTPPQSMIAQLGLTVPFLGWALALLAWVKFKEKRSIRSVGLTAGAFRGLLVGSLVGFGMTAIVVAVNLIAGTATLGSFSWGALGGVLIVLVGFAIQSSTEEIVFRGYLSQALARWGAPAAFLLQAVVFSALHSSNGGATFVTVLNLFLFATFLAAWTYVTGNLWAACAWHTVWNWAQGNIWGAAVSNNPFATRMAHYSTVDGSPSWLTGGGFGFEGSVVATVMFAAATVYLLVRHRRARS
ncbi:CPBP family intramembrane metalloprotease [Kocuria tytonicola]|uniref:CPBP family intramembrane metalloprotease n=1 Tax=Kocuria tytonicola TaxID=2055946 RepID=A0A3L9L2Y5_9MICC|nr:CPBP family intramembrane metalloprotease [Kocuria tytonicola]